jgi:hypothetical protein
MRYCLYGSIGCGYQVTGSSANPECSYPCLCDYQAPKSSGFYGTCIANTDLEKIMERIDKIERKIDNHIS